ncbi:MAG: zinc-binding alcohol dehydrogenase family protein [Rhodothermales bacterium]
MNAFYITAPGHTDFGPVAPPELKADEVLLRISTIGFCGTDLSTFRGRNPLVSYPRIPGHEIAARVESVGADVPDGLMTVGEAVTVVPYTTCGRCAACRCGRTNCCANNETLGVQRDGAMQPFLAVPHANVLPAPRLSLSELALVEPLSVGDHAVLRGQVDGGDTVAVFGCGAIGLGAILSAAYRGARVIAIDLDDAKLAVAQQCGAAYGLNARTSDVAAQLRDLTDGHGLEVLIEAVGVPETFVGAIEHVAFAGRVVYIGYAKAPVTYNTALFVKKELDIRGSRNATAASFENVIQMMHDGRVPMDAFVTRTVDFANAGTALAAWDADPGSVTRIHIRLGD